MLDRAILDTKLDSRPMDLSFLNDILKHMQKPRFSDSDKVDKRLLIKFNQFNPNSKFIKSNLVGTKTASPVLIKNIGQNETLPLRKCPKLCFRKQRNSL
ncbi:hypothetical protein MM0348_07590 [Helicobacter pylori]